MININKVFMSPEVTEKVNQVLTSGYVGEGDIVKNFESEFAHFINYNENHICALNSATSSLHLAIHMLNLPRDSEILSTPLTCMATNAAIFNNGHKIIWVDIDSKTLNIDLIDLERKITKKTNAIVVVHFAGNPIDYKKLQELSFGIPIIEDCAHALGAKFDNKHVGTFSNTSVFSFQAVKPLSCGDGGILVTNSTWRAKKLRWYGIDRENRVAPVTECGFKYSMNNISASIGLANLPHLSKLIKTHQENAREYIEKFVPSDEWQLIESVDLAQPSYYLFPILVKRKNNFIKYMKENDIECSPVHERNDIYPCFDEFKCRLPILDKIADQIVMIPVGWWVSVEDRERIIDVFNRGW